MRQTDIDLQRVRRYVQSAVAAERGRLPPERDLADELGLTRNRLRGSLRKLAAEGAIWRHVGRGTFVGAPPADAAPPATATAARRTLAQKATPREILEARLALEPSAARLAAFHGTLASFAQLRDVAAQLRLASDNEAWGALDTRLHRAVFDAAGNTVLLSMFEVLHMPQRDQIWGRLRGSLQTPERRAAADRQHGALVEAICDRDPDAAERLMRTHLRSVQQVIFDPGR